MVSVFLVDTTICITTLSTDFKTDHFAGALSGSLASLKSHELGSAAITGALIRADVRPEEVDDVIMGQVLTAGQGMNPARQAAVQSQVPYATPAATVSMVCGSGLRYVWDREKLLL